MQDGGQGSVSRRGFPSGGFYGSMRAQRQRIWYGSESELPHAVMSANHVGSTRT